jgi:hypothetical protein
VVDDIQLKIRLKENFDAVFFPGAIWTIQGPVRGEKKGTAKSTWAVQVIQQAAEHGYIALTNIMHKAPVRDENRNITGWGPEHGLAKVQTPEMAKTGGMILKVRSFAEAIYMLSETGTLKQRKRSILAIDESMMITGVRGGSGSGLQTKEGVTIAALNSQIRKLGLCILIIGLGDRFLAGMYRSDEAGTLVTGSMRRVKVPGYDIKEVIEVKTAVGLEHFHTMPLRGLARPQDWLTIPDADDGPVFESFSPATFSMGVFRKSRKAFEMNEFLAAISDVISEHTDAAVVEFLDREGFKGDVPAPPTVDEPRDPRVPPPTLMRPDRAEQVREMIRRGGMSDAEIARSVIPPVTRQRVHQIRRAMSTLLP